MITVAALVACGIGPTQARIFAEPLAASCRRFEINSRPRVAGFVAQCAVESTLFQQLEEGMYYRTPERIALVFKRLQHRGMADLTKLARNPKALANAAYAGINGNGDEASGDGWRYRGRGLKQLTGLGNYRDAEAGLGRPYVEQPGLVAQPEDACLTAAWYWHNTKCNILADSSQWDAITRAVNGPAMLQATERRVMTEEALRALA